MGEEREIDEYVARALSAEVRNVGMSAFGIAAIMLSIGSLALILVGRQSENFSYILSGGCVQILLNIMFFLVFWKGVRFHYAFAFGVGFVLNGLVAGGTLVGFGQQGGGIYSGYIIPLFLVIVPLTLRTRIVVTLLGELAFVSPFLFSHDGSKFFSDIDSWVTSLPIVVGTSILYGHLVFLRLKQSYFNEFRLNEARKREEAGNHVLRESLLLSADRIRELRESLETTQNETRLAIARDLHDDVAQILTGTKLQLALFENAMGHDPNMAELGELSATITDMEKNMRSAIARLRSASSDSSSYLDTIDLMIEKWRERHIAHFSVEGKLSLVPTRYHEMIYRFLQEGLSNVAKHAPASSEVKMLVDFQSEKDWSLRLCNFPKTKFQNDLTPKGYGLEGLRERAAAMGGTVSMQHDDEHTSLVLRIGEP